MGKHSKYEKIIIAVFWTIIGLTIFTAFTALMFKPIRKAEINTVEYDWSADWTLKDSDGNTVYEGSLPYQLSKAERNSVYSIEKTLPDEIEVGSALMFRVVYADVTVYVDGRPRAIYNDENYRLFGKTSLSGYLTVKLSAADAGKTVTIESVSPYKISTGRFEAIQLGDELDLREYLIKSKLSELLFAMIFIFVGFVVTIIGVLIYASTQGKMQTGLFYLGLALLFYGLEPLYSIGFFDYLVGGGNIWYLFGRVGGFLLGVPIVMFFNIFLERKHERKFLSAAAMNLGIMVFCFTLQIFNLCDLVATQNMKNVGLILDFTMIVYIAIKEYRFGNRFKANAVLLSSFLMILDFIYQMISSFFMGKLYAFNFMYPVLILAVGILTATSLREVVTVSQRAELESSAKSEFLANMSHEIRTPINAILGMDEMILRESKEDSTLMYATNIQNSGQILLGLVNDVLDISKIEAGTMDIYPTKYAPARLLLRIVTMTKTQADSRGLTFKANIDENVPKLLYGDEKRITQVIANLLNNAVKYTDSGEVRLSIIKSKESDPEYVRFTVSVEDTGIGIREEDLDSLFDTFKRVENEHTRGVEGAGLGLAIANRLVKLMGSRLYVESHYGVGSRFWFTLRQKVIDAEPIGNFDAYMREQSSSSYEYTGAFRAPDARVLVVDDNDINRLVISGLLKPTEMTVDTASSGAICLEKMKENYYDIVFMDQLMPGMSGMETLEAIRKMKDNKNPNVPIIALTADAITGAKELYLGYGFVDYLSKPVDSKLLEETVMKYLPQSAVIRN